MTNWIWLGICLALSALTTPLLAETFVVTKTEDDDGPCLMDDCALREAVLAANALPGKDIIELPAGVYRLSILGIFENMAMTGDLDILDDLDILGSGPTTTRVVGSGDRVFHSAATMTLANMTITGGSVGGFGGAAINTVTTDLTIINCDISGNTTSSDGGGINISLGSAVLIDSAVHGNIASGCGGGIRRFGAVQQFADIELINTTVSNNEASFGGGVCSEGPGKMIFNHATIANNKATNRGAGLFDISSRDPTFKNSMFVNNDCGNFSSFGTISNGGNIESPGNTCFIPAPGDRVNVPDAGLGPLAFNGGPTRNHALLPGSPAIDTAIDADCQMTDQRGRTRPVDGDDDGTARCDVGAVERLPGDGAAEIPTLNRGSYGLLVLTLAITGASFLIRRRRSI